MMSYKIFIFYIILCIIHISCKHKEIVRNVEKSFYYWKTESINEQDVDLLNNLNVKKLYFKIFEVGYNDVQGNFPYNKNSLSYYSNNMLDSITIIPTIYIRNEVLQNNDEKSLDKLSDNIVFLVNKYSLNTRYDGSNNTIFNYNEIQIDCDYTTTTKDKYYYLLKRIKTRSKKIISCTLRLYPYKYTKIMGVPPVDKATLMCYNLIKPLTNQDKNSILDLDELQKYFTEKKKYPIHLDIALPIFYWSQVYKNNQFTQLIKLKKKEVASFTVEIKPMWYQVLKDTSINDEIYLKAGDQIKCEEISVSNLNQAIQIIKNKVELDNTVTVSLFDLNENNINQFTNEQISNFYNSLHN